MADKTIVDADFNTIETAYYASLTHEEREVVMKKQKYSP